MQDRLFETLRQLNTPYAEIRLERRETTRLVYRGDQLVTVDTSIDYGGFARALANHGGWGARLSRAMPICALTCVMRSGWRRRSRPIRSCWPRSSR